MTSDNIYVTDAGNISLVNSGTDNVERTLPEIIIYGVLLGFLAIGTVFGNVLVCVAVATNRQLRRNVTNVFVVSLAVSDLLLAILVLPLSLVKTITHEWYFGQVICNLYISMDIFLSTASILNLFVVTIDRYYAITKPLKYKTFVTTCRAGVALSLVWIVACAVAFVPVYLGWNTKDGTVQNSDSDESCDFPVENLCYSLALGIGTFFIPLVMMYSMYTKILRISYVHMQRIKANLPADVKYQNTSVARQHRATITLAIIVGAFSMCWLPYFTVFTILPLESVSVSPVLADAFLWMGYANSFVNPFVYAFTNKEFHVAFKKLLCSGCIPKTPYQV